MSDVSIWDSRTPTKALRHLIMGRVLLKADYTDGVTVKVGTERTLGPGIPGTMMFCDKSTLCKLVEPETAPGAGNGYEENVTIVNPTDGEPLHITLTEAASKDFHTARGAYLALRTMAEPIASLQLVQQDLALPVGTPDAKLPAVWVRCEQSAKEHAGGPEWRCEFLWRCRFYRQRTEGEDTSDAFETAFDVILNQIEEDHRIGGTVEQGYVRQARRPDELSGFPFDTGEFVVWAHVLRVHSKAL